MDKIIDSVVIAKFRNRRELSEFPKDLLAMEYVERTNSFYKLGQRSFCI